MKISTEKGCRVVSRVEAFAPLGASHYFSLVVTGFVGVARDARLFSPTPSAPCIGVAKRRQEEFFRGDFGLHQPFAFGPASSTSMMSSSHSESIGGKVLGEDCCRNQADHGSRQTQVANVVLNFPLALPVRNAGVPFCSASRAVDEVFHAGSFRRVRHVLPLLHFTFRAHSPEVLNTVNAIRTLGSARDRRRFL